jgi:uncharacterized protein (TIGR03435 family)
MERCFQLKAHRESKEMPIYALAVEKGGIKFQKSPDDEKMKTRGGRGTLNFQHATISDLAGTLARFEPPAERFIKTEPGEWACGCVGATFYLPDFVAG